MGNIVGKRYGFLLVIEKTRVRRHGRSRSAVVCRCDCGNTKTIDEFELAKGSHKSCGCKKVERFKSHGRSDSPCYGPWKSMIGRCKNKSSPSFRYYGGRGISVCERWLDIRNFIEDMGERPKGTTLDRIDASGNYEPGNCRWATPKQQARNRTYNRKVAVNGREFFLVDLAAESGISVQTLENRLNSGMNIIQAISIGTRQKTALDGELLTRRQIAKRLGVPYQTFISATHRLTTERAIIYFQNKTPKT